MCIRPSKPRPRCFSQPPVTVPHKISTVPWLEQTEVYFILRAYQQQYPLGKSSRWKSTTFWTVSPRDQVVANFGQCETETRQWDTSWVVSRPRRWDRTHVPGKEWNPTFWTKTLQSLHTSTLVCWAWSTPDFEDTVSLFFTVCCSHIQRMPSV